MKLSTCLAASHLILILFTSFRAIQTTTAYCFFNIQTNETWKVVWDDNFDADDLSSNWLIRHETNYCDGRLSPTGGPLIVDLIRSVITHTGNGLQTINCNTKRTENVRTEYGYL